MNQEQTTPEISSCTDKKMAQNDSIEVNFNLPQMLAATLSMSGIYVSGTSGHTTDAKSRTSEQPRPVAQKINPELILAALNRVTEDQNCKKITTKTENNVPLIEAKHETKHSSKPIMIIPAGTQVCPERRSVMNQELYYITLDRSIEIYLDNPDTLVNINGTTFHVIDASRYDAKHRTNSDSGVCPCPVGSVAGGVAGGICSSDRKKLQSFVVPKGTPYYVNDNIKDPVGLLHSFDADERVRIRPESSVYLPEETEVILFDNTFVAGQTQNGEKSLPVNDVHMILKNRTKCTV